MIKSINVFRRIMIVSLNTIILFCLTLNINAQQKKKYPVKRFLFHSHGISFQTFENLNKRISLYPQFEQSKNSTGTFQFGIVTERNKLITSFSINAGSSLSGKRDKKSTATNFMGFSADAGYNLLQNTRLAFYPFAGLGYEKFKATFNRDNSTLSFDSVLQSVNFQQGTENLVLTNSFIVYRLGLGINVTSRKHLEKSLGLQVGYSGGFNGNDWKINKSQILLNSPKDNLSKFFTSVIIRYQLKHKS